MTRTERIKRAVAYLKGEQLIKFQRDIAEAMSANEGNVSQALKGDRKYLTDDFLCRFADAFSQINKNWLLTGDGQMLKEQNQHIGDVSGTGNVVLQGGGNQHDITVHGTDAGTFVRMMHERDEKINMMLDKIDSRFAKYDEVIAIFARDKEKCHEAIEKAQSHIDRLLTLLERK